MEFNSAFRGLIDSASERFFRLGCDPSTQWHVLEDRICRLG